MGLLKLKWLACIMLVQIAPQVLAWGDDGHFATCKLAEGYLTESARTAVNKLLPKSANGELAAVCSWPDLPQVKKGLYPWSSELHFSDTPDGKCTYDYCRDCHDSANQINRCVVGAIYNYTQQLASAYHHSGAENKYNLTEAIMFLSHFMGDVHQPLHMGFLGDLGGNRVKVNWYNKTTNLHRVWDDDIITSAEERFYRSNLSNLIEALRNNIKDSWSDEIELWKECEHSVCPTLYASESILLACKYAYKDAAPGSQLDDDYFLSRLPIVEKRLAQGGMRLAATLNRIYTHKVEKQKRIRSISEVQTMIMHRCPREKFMYRLIRS